MEIIISDGMEPTMATTLVEKTVQIRKAARQLQKSRIQWECPRRVLVIVKPDSSLLGKAQSVIAVLLERGIEVLVETRQLLNVYKNEEINGNSENGNNSSASVKLWDRTVVQAPDIDLICTLGGDGTVLHAAWLFQTLVPPILPFHLGTLGFLTVFDFGTYRSTLNSLLSACPFKPSTNGQLVRSQSTSSSSQLDGIDNSEEGGIRITLRMRFTCSVYRASTIMNKPLEEPLTECSGCPEPDEVYQVLNDLVVDRGPSPYMASLEVFGDSKHLTTVQADGLVVASPTGSTAYSLSAGGSMVHPEIPAILLTPICAHTLSFRPMLLPDSMELKIIVPTDSRGGAWASFDGRHRLELLKGDAIVVTACGYPVPTLCRHDQTKDWFDSLGRCLKWNERLALRQKAFKWGQGVVEEDIVNQENEDEI